MRRALALVWLLFPCLLFGQAYTTITATNVTVDNGSGTAVNPPSGSSLCFLGVNNAGAAITYTPSGGSPVSGTVCGTLNSTGGLTGTLQVANPATASPLGLLYTITVVNGGTTYLTIPTVSLSGTVWSFDAYGLPGTGIAVGIGKPHMACAGGAQWTSTTLPPGQNSALCNSSGSWQPYPPAPYCPSGQAYNVPQSGGTPFCLPPSLSGNGAPSGTCTQNSTYFQQDTTSLYVCKSAAWVLIASSSPGVVSINGAAGSFTFTGSGVSCTSTTCTFSGGSSLSLTTNDFAGPARLASGTLNVPVYSFCPYGIGAAVGAFTDSGGHVQQALCFGDGPTSFVVPSGATQLQLGINDDFFNGNTGSFVLNVSVNGGAASPVTISGTTMPWDPSINSNYNYGLNDGTAPVVATTGLAAGNVVTVTYSSGTVNVGPGIFPNTDANGWLSSPPGAAGHGGPTESALSPSSVYWPSRYMGQGYTGPGNTGNAITALTGDVTATGPGSAAATLAIVNSSPGICGDASHVCQVTTNGKGLVTAQSQVALTGGGFSAGGDLTGTSTSQTVIGLQNKPLPSPSLGYLFYDGSALNWSAMPAMVVSSSTAITASCGQWIRATSSSAITITLPAPTTATGKCQTVIERGTSAGAITITPASGTYDGASANLQQGQSMTVLNDGTNWHSQGIIIPGANCSWTPNLTGNVLNCTSTSGLSGMTAGQVPIAATATTVTSSKTIQGTDTNLLSSGTVSGTGSTLCTDANGGATTTGCSSGGASLTTLAMFPIENYGGVGDGNLPANTGTDNLAAFNSAIAAATAAHGGYVLLQCNKQYLVSGPIVITANNVGIVGNCSNQQYGTTVSTTTGGAVVFVNSASATVLDLHGVSGPTSGWVQYNTFRNVAFQRSVFPPAAGSKTCSIQNAGAFIFDHGFCDDSQYDMYFNGTAAFGTGLVSNWRVDNGCVTTYTAPTGGLYGYYVDGSTQGNPSLRFSWIFADNCEASTVSMNGFYQMGPNVSDISVIHLETALNQIGLTINGASGSTQFTATDIKYQDLVLDGNYTSAVLIENLPYQMSPAINLTDSWLNCQDNGSGTNSCVDIESANDVTLSGNHIYITEKGLTAAGIKALAYVHSSSHINLTGNIFNMGYLHANTGSDWILDGTALSTVTGNISDSPASSNIEGKLINTSTGNTITGNVFGGVASVGMSADATSINNHYLNLSNSCASGVTTCISDAGTGNQFSSASLTANAVQYATSSTATRAATDTDISGLQYVADSGVADAYVATLSPAISSYTAGLSVKVKIANTNTTTTPTLNVNGIGAVTITKNGAAAVVAGDVAAGQIQTFQYDGTHFQLMNPATVVNAVSPSSPIVASISAGTLSISCPTCGTSTGTAVNMNGGTTLGTLQITGNTTQACSDTSGSGTAQSCNTATSFTPWTNSCVVYTTTTTNSGTGLTVNVNSLGAKSVAIPGSSGWTTALTASTIPANKPLTMCYDGTNWDVQQTGVVASGGGGTPNFTGTRTFVSEQSSSLASVTTPAITITAGDVVIVACRGGTATITSATITDSNANTWTNVSHSTFSNNPWIQMSFSKITTGGSTTFTCTPNVSSQFMSMVVMDFTWTPTTPSDVGSTSSTSGNSTTWGSSSYSTTAKSFSITCGTFPSTSAVFTPIRTLGVPASLLGISAANLAGNDDMGCQESLVPYPVTNGNASISVSISGTGSIAGVSTGFAY